MTVKLGDRLLKAAGYVPKGVKIADIGTDHAYLPIYLIKKGICPEAIATEVKLGPYLRAIQNLRREQMEQFVEMRYGPGLSPLCPGEVQVAIIAGMGGEVMADIIHDCRNVAQSVNMLILQPMTRLKHLRAKLYEMGFQIIDEDVVQEGNRFYEIIIAKAGDVSAPDLSDIILGPVLRKKNEDIIFRYFAFRGEKLERMIRQMEGQSKLAAPEVLKQYVEELEIVRGTVK